MKNRCFTHSFFKIKLFFILLILSLNILAQHPYQSIIGNWKGKLKTVSGESITLLVAIIPHGDSVHVELDSPDQYATEIPVNFFSFKNDTISLKVFSLYASYTGVYNAETASIVGYFTQGNIKRKVILEKSEERWRMNRPQEPQPPYPYIEEEISILHPEEKRSWIQGTLTLPQDTSPKALIILISGSGWQDRDEKIMGHKPFKLIAHHLTQHGIAVFRYDDLPHDFFQQATTQDFVDAVSLILDSLSIQPRFSNLKKGLLGHSEGGLVAFMTAAKDERVDFIISLAGMADNLKQTLLYQVEAISSQDTTFTQEDIEASIKISKEVYNTIEKAKTKQDALKKCKKILEKYDSKFSNEQKNKLGLSIENRLATLQLISSPWYFYLFHLNPTHFIKKVSCPVYALNGEKDLQVDYLAHLSLIKKYLPKNELHKIQSFPNLNHLFQECETGLPMEYGKIEQTMSPEILESIVAWLTLIL